MTALLLVAAQPAISDRAQCSIKRLDACETTNQLVWDKGFERALRAFLGSRRTGYLYRGGRLADEAIAVLGGPPNERVEIDGRYLFTACRAQSCTEKGAAVLSSTGEIDAVGILWYPCADPNRVSDDCPYRARLTLFMRDPGDGKLIARLTGWVEAELAKYRPATLPPIRLERVQIHRRPIPIR
ncbi:MAG TPA: hypothetical protein VM308_07220 [Sphingomicrobium sp.]|nr:hypothetical protein [Sphingomicrobium sp.]